MTEWTAAPATPKAARMALTINARCAAGLDLGDCIEQAMGQIEAKHGHLPKGAAAVQESLAGPGWHVDFQYAWIEGEG